MDFLDLKDFLVDLANPLCFIKTKEPPILTNSWRLWLGWGFLLLFFISTFTSVLGGFYGGEVDGFFWVGSV